MWLFSRKGKIQVTKNRIKMMRNDAKYATYVFFNFFFRWMKNLSALKNLLTSIVSSTWKQEKAIMYNCLIKKAHFWWHISLITNLCAISMLYFVFFFHIASKRIKNCIICIPSFLVFDMFLWNDTMHVMKVSETQITFQTKFENCWKRMN